MNRLRKLTLVVGTVGIAIGAGHLVESRTAPAPAALPTAVVPVSAGPDPAASPVLAAPVPAAPVAAPAAVPPPVASVPDCAASLRLIPLPGGDISVWLKAPCAADARVELRQDGIATAWRVLPSGNLFVTLPALSARPVVAARLASGDTVIAMTEVPEVAGLRRIGVAWAGRDAFQLLVDGGLSPVVLGDGGVDRPLRAAVATLPPGGAMPTLEAAVTPSTCGREMTGQIIVQDGARAGVSDLALSMPGCDAVGDILVLNDLLPDLTLAAR